MSVTFATRRIPFTPNLYAVVDAKTGEPKTQPQPWEDAERARKSLQASEDARQLEDVGTAAMMGAWSSAWTI